MEPGSVVILAVQNPGEAAVIIARDFGLTPNGAIEQYGDQIKQGAFVSLTERDNDGNTASVALFVADRVGDTLYLQDNSFMSDSEAPSIDDIGSTVASGEAPLTPNPAELETFTVFGNNDDGEAFVAVVTATEDTVYNVGVQAGLVDEGFENSVTIDLIVKGEQADLERVEV